MTQDSSGADLTGLAVPLSDEEQAVVARITGGQWSKYARVAMAALSSLPWVGIVMNAATTLAQENSQDSSYRAMYWWVKVHEDKLREVAGSLQEMFERFESFGDGVEERVNSEEYMSLVRKTFTQWDHAETDEKKQMLRKLITNAGGLNIAQDDLVRMFLDWIDRYHEFHFSVIGEVYKQPGITRREIWTNLRGSVPRDDSEEADLFRLLLHDLSTGRVIRQHRETDALGHFVKQQPQRRSTGQSSSVYESAFEATKPYVLTELGKQFVHYVLTDLATPLTQAKASPSPPASSE
ncbi:MAG TPA: hypothetical protein VHR97_07140 [Candidatus Baltobacteraceae bacterium]|jgi:hypothetical protein|nr:hypothetical protein [Candidatus Baltobacteraceae bacterium]